GADIDDKLDLALIDAKTARVEHEEREIHKAALLAFAIAPPEAAARTGAVAREDDHLTDVERAMVAATADLAVGPAEAVPADLDTRGDRTVWVVTGAKAGTTVGRVGTDPSRPHFVFEVHVVPPKPRR